jgi:hypothetical protein
VVASDAITPFAAATGAAGGIVNSAGRAGDVSTAARTDAADTADAEGLAVAAD